MSNDNPEDIFNQVNGEVGTNLPAEEDYNTITATSAKIDDKVRTIEGIA